MRRNFVRSGDGYQINKAIRDLCVFARQNLVKDPPFSNLDLLSCRNLLIYLGPGLQKRVVPIFHYALKPNGYLLLGRSETIGSFADLFSLAHREQKIYAKKPTATRLPPELRAPEAVTAPTDTEAHCPVPPAAERDLAREADQLLLSPLRAPGGDREPGIGYSAFSRPHRPVPGAVAGGSLLESAADGPVRFGLRLACGYPRGP